MALYYDLPQREAYVLSELFIDTRYQRMGYGTAATAALLAQMRADGRWRRVLLCYIEGNDAARGLYASFGFCENGARDEDEIEMEPYSLNAPKKEAALQECCKAAFLNGFRVHPRM